MKMMMDYTTLQTRRRIREFVLCCKSYITLINIGLIHFLFTEKSLILQGLKMSIVTTPREVLVTIFGYLKQSDLVRIAKTCHLLNDVVSDPTLWKKLTLTYEKIQSKNEACRNHVSRCSKLQEIFIAGQLKVIKSDEIMAVVMKANDTLTSINISQNYAGLNNSSFEKIGDMTQLTHLAVGGGKLGQGGIAALANLTELKSLKIPGIRCGKYFGLPDVSFPMAALVDLFSTLNKLEVVEIKMDGNFPTDLVLESLVNNNPKLHHLDISSTGHPMPMHYIPMDEHDYSRSLNLLADKCPQQTYINIGYSGAFFNNISITQLVTNCPKLKHANFEETMLDDTALDVMSTNCPDLEYLKISGCSEVTQDGLERFVYPACAANLKCLDICNDFSTISILKNSGFMMKLKQDLPNLKIVTRFDDEDDDEDDKDLEYYYSSDDEDD